MTTIKISFTVPFALQDEVRKAVVDAGYGLRGKSKWASEAITTLLAQKNFPFLVNVSDELAGLDKTETICIDAKLKKSIDAAVLEVRKKYMSMEGIQSRIIRTALMQKLLRGTAGNQKSGHRTKR